MVDKANMKAVIVLIVLNLLFIVKYAGEKSIQEPDRSLATILKIKNI